MIVGVSGSGSCGASPAGSDAAWGASTDGGVASVGSAAPSAAMAASPPASGSAAGSGSGAMTPISSGGATLAVARFRVRFGAVGVSSDIGRTSGIAGDGRIPCRAYPTGVAGALGKP